MTSTASCATTRMRGASRECCCSGTQGADTPPFMINRSRPTVPELVRATVLIGMGAEASSIFHVSHWIGTPKGGTADAAGSHELDGSGPGSVFTARATTNQRAGTAGTGARSRVGRGHHFDGDYAALAMPSSVPWLFEHRVGRWFRERILRDNGRIRRCRGWHSREIALDRTRTGTPDAVETRAAPYPSRPRCRRLWSRHAERARSSAGSMCAGSFVPSKRRLALDEQRAARRTDLRRLVDQVHLRVHRDHRVELGDVLRVHADEPCRDLHAETRRPVGAVDEVRAAGTLSRNGDSPNGSSGPGGTNGGTDRPSPRARAGPTLADTSWGAPASRLTRVAPSGVSSRSRRRRSVRADDARLTRLGGRIVVEAMLGQVDRRFPRAGIGQHERLESRTSAPAGQPGVDTGVGGNDLLVTDAVARPMSSSVSSRSATAMLTAPITLSPLSGNRNPRRPDVVRDERSERCDQRSGQPAADTVKLYATFPPLPASIRATWRPSRRCSHASTRTRHRP